MDDDRGCEFVMAIWPRRLPSPPLPLPPTKKTSKIWLGELPVGANGMGGDLGKACGGSRSGRSEKKSMSKMQVGPLNLKAGAKMKLHVDDTWMLELRVFASVFPRLLSP